MLAGEDEDEDNANATKHTCVCVCDQRCCGVSVLIEFK